MPKCLPHQIPASTRAYLQQHPDEPPAQSAAALGLSVLTIRTYRGVLIRAGELRRQDRVLSEAERDRIYELHAAGLTHPAIARRLRCASGTVSRILAGRGVSSAVIPSRGALAALFDVPATTVRIWLRMGWLTPSHSSGGAQRFTRSSVIAFVQLRAAWPSYRAELITDATIRQVAQASRRAGGGRWIALQEVAAAGRIPDYDVAAAERCGWLAGWEWTTIGRRRYLWLPNGATVPRPPADPRIHRPRGKGAA